MTAQRVIDITPQNPIEDALLFLPPALRESVMRFIRAFDSTHIDVDQVLMNMLTMAEDFVQVGLDATVDGVEKAVEVLYEAGWMDRLGALNSFARDGAEMGIQIGINTLKALTPTDVAKIVGIALVFWLAPNMFAANGAEFLAIAAEIGTKLWNLG